jgi:hypothetical protein
MATKRPDGRVEPGQRISSAFSARAWNRAQDAADVVLGARTGAEAGASAGVERASNIVLVRNDSGETVPWLGVIGFKGVVIDPSGGTLDGTNDASKRAREFVSKPVLVGDHPSTNFFQESSGLMSIGEKIGIAIEPIGVDKIGRAAIGGAFACQVYINSQTHGFAVPVRALNAIPDGGNKWELNSADCGPVKLLWKQEGTGTMKWAVGTF